jgi:hypothetical protein
MEIAVAEQARPWARAWWKPVRGKEGVFAYIVIIHVLAVIGLILFPLPNWKVLAMAVLFAGLGGWAQRCAITVCCRIKRCEPTAL